MHNRRQFLNVLQGIFGLGLGSSILSVPASAQNAAGSSAPLSDSNDDRFNNREFVLKNTAVLNITGRVFINGYPVKEGDRLYPFSSIITSPGSQITFRLADASIFKIAQKAIVKFYSSKQSSGIFAVNEGAITGVIAPGVISPYILQTQTIFLKIYRSVFYMQRLIANQAFRDAAGSEVTFDFTQGDYLFCLCNGSADLVSQQNNRTYWLTEADYHKTILINEMDDEIKLKKVAQLNHTDNDLLQLIQLEKINPYPINWLKLPEVPMKAKNG